MTCVVLTRNPNGGGVLAITTSNDSSEIARWPTKDSALEVARDHPLVEAWGGWVVDLDNLEVTEA